MPLTCKGEPEAKRSQWGCSIRRSLALCSPGEPQLLRTIQPARRSVTNRAERTQRRSPSTLDCDERSQLGTRLGSDYAKRTQRGPCSPARPPACRWRPLHLARTGRGPGYPPGGITSGITNAPPSCWRSRAPRRATRGNLERNETKPTHVALVRSPSSSHETPLPRGGAVDAQRHDAEPSRCRPTALTFATYAIDPPPRRPPWLDGPLHRIHILCRHSPPNRG
jgi:hypothetical protein